MLVMVLVMLLRKEVGDVEEEGDCEGPRVEVAVNDDHDDDNGGVGYDFKDGGWRW